MKNVVTKIVKAVNRFTNITGLIICWLSFLLMLLILADVVTRYLPFMKPLAMSDEFGGYALVAITMGGLAYAWRERAHVKVEFFLSMLKPKTVWMLGNITIVIAFGFALLITYAAYDHISQAFMFKTRSNTWVRTVLAYPQLSIIIGLILLDLQLFAEVLDRFFLGRDKPGDAQKQNVEDHTCALEEKA